MAIDHYPIGYPFVKRPNINVGGQITRTPAVPLDIAWLDSNASEFEEFAGVSVRDGEPLDTVNGSHMNLQSEGYALARVLGPCSVNDPIGFSLELDTDWRVALSTDFDVQVGKALQSINTESVRLIKVLFGGSGSPSDNKMFYLMEVHDEYLVGVPFGSDPSSFYAPKTAIAKQPRMRPSITTEVKLGVEHKYTYQDDNYVVNTTYGGVETRFNQKIRIDNDQHGSIESQRIVPVWLYQEPIAAIPMNTGINDDEGNPIKYLMAENRYWTAF